MLGSQMQTGRGPAPTRRTMNLERLETRDVPTVFAVADQYTVAAGRNLVVSAQQGVLSNDFSDNAQALLRSFQQGTITYVGTPTSPTGKFPAITNALLTLNSNGSFQFSAPSSLPNGATGVQFTYIATDANSPGDSATATVTINIPAETRKLYAVGSGAGIASQVRVFDGATGLERFQAFFPYETSFTGGVRVATGDVTGDGIDDIITAPGLGGSARVQVYDGKDGVKIQDYFAFEDTFRGGADVAIGDIDGDLRNDIIIGAGDGGGPRVQIFNGSLVGKGTLAGSAIADFFAYENTFRNGVRVASGELDDFSGNPSDRRDYIVTGPGTGGGPAVRVFDGREVLAGARSPTQPPALRSFFAFDSSQRGGVNVAVGQFRGDGLGDIVVGQGSGSQVVRVFDGRTLAQLREFTVPTTDNPTATPNTSSPIPSGGSVNFSGNPLPGTGLVVSGGGSSNGTGGVRVAVTDRNADGRSDIVVGPGPGAVPRVRIYDGITLAEVDNFLAFQNSFLGGVFVGGNSL